MEQTVSGALHIERSDPDLNSESLPQSENADL